MKFVEIIEKNISKTMNSIAAKNKKLTFLNRIRLSLRTEYETLNDAYVKLGKYYYENFRDSANEDNKELCNVIDKCVSNIGKLKNEYYGTISTEYSDPIDDELDVEIFEIPNDENESAFIKEIESVLDDDTVKPIDGEAADEDTEKNFLETITDENKESSDEAATDESEESSDETVTDEDKESSDEAATDDGEESSDEAATDGGGESSDEAATDGGEESSDEAATDENKESSDETTTNEGEEISNKADNESNIEETREASNYANNEDNKKDSADDIVASIKDISDADDFVINNSFENLGDNVSVLDIKKDDEDRNIHITSDSPEDIIAIAYSQVSGKKANDLNNDSLEDVINNIFGNDIVVDEIVDNEISDEISLTDSQADDTTDNDEPYITSNSIENPNFYTSQATDNNTVSGEYIKDSVPENIDSVNNTKEDLKTILDNYFGPDDDSIVSNPQNFKSFANWNKFSDSLADDVSYICNNNHDIKD